MATLTPVDYDPFSTGSGPKLTEVSHDPFGSPVTLGGSIKAAATGAGTDLVSQALGLPGDLAAGVDWLFDKFGPSTSPERRAYIADLRSGLTAPPTSAAVEKTADDLGLVHQSQNKTEERIRNVSNFIPTALLGPEAWATNAIKRGVVPGVISQAAGEATEGTAAEPYARLAGSLVSLGAPRTIPPTSQTLKDVGGAGNQATRDMGFAADGNSTAAFANRTLNDLNARNRDITATGAPGQTSDILRDFTNRGVVEGKDYDALKLRLQAVTDNPGAAQDAIRALHDHVTSLGPSDTLFGNPDTFKQVWNDARGNYAAGASAERFEDIAKKATDKAASQTSGLNTGAKVRDAYAGALNDYKTTRGLRPEEVAQLQKLVDGSPLWNGVRELANRAGGGGGIGASIIGGMAGYGASHDESTGGAAALATMLGARGLRMAYNHSVTNQANRLSETIRSRAPLAQQMAPAPFTHVTPGVQRILNMAHALQIAHGS